MFPSSNVCVENLWARALCITFFETERTDERYIGRCIRRGRMASPIHLCGVRRRVNLCARGWHFHMSVYGCWTLAYLFTRRHQPSQPRLINSSQFAVHIFVHICDGATSSYTRIVCGFVCGGVATRCTFVVSLTMIMLLACVYKYISLQKIL